MLVLTRRINEKIVMPTIGTTIQVVAAKPGVVRIGVEAPDTVPVFREEVLERLDALERDRLVTANPAASAQLVAQVQLLTDALAAAAADLALLRRQMSLWQREDLGVALDRITRDLRAVQQKAATTNLPPATVTPELTQRANCAAY